MRNAAATIVAAVRSALSQALSPIEVIVVDDASEDGGAGLVAALGDPRVRILRRDAPGAGGYAARNLAIRVAQAEWIAFLDADDVWSPKHLSGLAEAVRQVGSSTGGAFSAYVNHYGDRDTRSPVASALRGGGAIGLQRFLAAWLETETCPVLTSACAFRRTLLLAAGLFPESGVRRGGDKDLWLRSAARADLAFAPQHSMRFDRTGAHKITRTEATNGTPHICGTINTLLKATDDVGLKRLLIRLANQEVRLYARQAFLRAPLAPEMKRALHMPDGWREWLMLTGMEATPAPLAAMLRAATGRRQFARHTPSARH